MKLHYLLPIVALHFLLYGCKGKSPETTAFVEESETPFVLSLERIHKDKGEELLSSITSEIEYIALETTDESVIGGIAKITRLNNGNLVIGGGERINMFSPTGRFIRTISQKGNGPADFTRISSLTANPETGGFYLLTNNKLIEFDVKGEYINSFSVEDRLMDMTLTPEGEIILHKMSIPKKPDDTEPTWFLFRYDKQGNELQRLEDISPRMGGDGILSVVTVIRPLYLYKDKVRFNEFGNDTIFTLRQEGLHPFAIVDLGEIKMSASPKGSNAEIDAVFAKMKEQLFLIYLSEDPQFLYMTFGWGFGGDYLYATYNKKTGKAVNYGNGGFFTTDVGLTNDVDGGLPFFPLLIQPDGNRIQWKSAENFKEEVLKKDYETNKKQYGDKFDKVYQLAQSLDEDDNPVLIIIR